MVFVTISGLAPQYVTMQQIVTMSRMAHSSMVIFLLVFSVELLLFAFVEAVFWYTKLLGRNAGAFARFSVSAWMLGVSTCLKAF